MESGKLALTVPTLGSTFLPGDNSTRLWVQVRISLNMLRLFFTPQTYADTHMHAYVFLSTYLST
jgi:hypothetical protein